MKNRNFHSNMYIKLAMEQSWTCVHACIHTKNTQIYMHTYSMQMRTYVNILLRSCNILNVCCLNIVHKYSIITIHKMNGFLCTVQCLTFFLPNSFMKCIFTKIQVTYCNIVIHSNTIHNSYTVLQHRSILFHSQY